MQKISDHIPAEPVIHGMQWFPGTTQEMVDTFPRLLARQDDIYISTYPKAGTTWTQEITWQIVHNGKIDYRPLDIRIPWIDSMIIPLPTMRYRASTPDMIEKMFESFPLPRVFKTHLTYDLVPKPRDHATQPRHIYVMRNPRDTAVSWYHHYSWTYSETQPSWNEYFELYCKGEVFCGSWFHHVLSWWKHKDEENILFLKYEEMKKDLSGAIKKIARFLGKELSQETVQCIANQTSFPAMKNLGNANYDWIPKYKGGFLRKGEVGDWRNYFSEEQIDRLDALFEEKMAGSGLVFEYD